MPSRPTAVPRTPNRIRKPAAAVPAADGPAAPRPSLSARAYDELRSRLRRGEVAPDARLVDLEIAAGLGMSRMPVREALLQLVSEGYLVTTARGYRLPTFTLHDILDLFEVRHLLEPRAAALAARDLTADVKRALDAALLQARRAQAQGDFAAFFHAQVDFREAWLRNVNNERLKGVVTRLIDQVQAVRHTTLHDPAIQRVALERLAELHGALVRRDPVAAEDSMRRFISAAELSFIAVMGSAADTTSPTPARKRRRTTP